MLRITRDELNNSHVDDMLKRQASLRGESDVDRSRRGRWFYQNWFVFMVAGMLAAVAAWALIEPYFDDTLYIQGTIQEIGGFDDTLRGQTARARLRNADDVLHIQAAFDHTDNGGAAPRLAYEPMQEFELGPGSAGWLKVNGQKVWLMLETKSIGPDGVIGPLDFGALKLGDEIGLHVAPEVLAVTGLAVAAIVVPDPPAVPSGKATMTIEQLSAQSAAASMLLFPLVASLIGLAVGAADGIVCRVFRRALLAGAIGLLVGFIGGFVSSIIAGLVYAPLNSVAMAQEADTASGLTTFGFLVQMVGRSLAWCLAGMAMGLGNGIALRSKRLLLYGFIGGIIGGLLGGLLFDPIDLILVGADNPSAHWSRMIGLGIAGATVGAMIGVVELLARDAWLRMVEGPLAGKEFLIFKDTMYIGSSPRSEVYLFNDDAIAPQHVAIRSVGENYEIEHLALDAPAYVNGSKYRRQRLHHGDQIVLGRTVFVFQQRKG